MNSRFGPYTRAIPHTAITPKPYQEPVFRPARSSYTKLLREKLGYSSASKNGSSGSYLEMWKKAKDRERQFQKLTAHSSSTNNLNGEHEGIESDSRDLERKSNDFMKLLEVPKDKREEIYREHVIDRAAAALSAARAILDDKQAHNTESYSTEEHSSDSSIEGIPGPQFWSWAPPNNDNATKSPPSNPKIVLQPPVALKEWSHEFLSIPFQSKTEDATSDTMEIDLAGAFSEHAEESVQALIDNDNSSSGVNEDGSRWWRETGTEQRNDGVICRWTMVRGVSADAEVEWQDKYWEAADELGYKELGSEKSGRDSKGNVWREFWRESLWEDCGLMHIEKTADKWGKNGEGEEWHEKWREHHDASNKTEKSAEKWCKVDARREVGEGHAHVWHERWGETFDGNGGSVKYTDKWAERREGDQWVKWGDKWDEHFDSNGTGVKQGETWWLGRGGDRWNRTWGEGHDGSGSVHKYGRSSSGEHWDTYLEEDTWYQNFPHYGFFHCFDNSIQLRHVSKPSER